jgi:hypothetical protein
VTQTDSVIAKLDELIADDVNFTTRIGLKFMTAVIRDALKVIGDIATAKDNDHKRLGELDNALTKYLAAQAEKETKAEAERTKWRWAMITPILGIVILEITRWILR